MEKFNHFGTRSNLESDPASSVKSRYLLTITAVTKFLRKNPMLHRRRNYNI